jgi:hypothetical protein
MVQFKIGPQAIHLILNYRWRLPLDFLQAEETPPGFGPETGLILC